MYVRPDITNLNQIFYVFYFFYFWHQMSNATYYSLDQGVSNLVLEAHGPACFSCFPALQEVFKFFRSLLIIHSFTMGVLKQRNLWNMQNTGPSRTRPLIELFSGVVVCNQRLTCCRNCWEHSWFGRTSMYVNLSWSKRHRQGTNDPHGPWVSGCVPLLCAISAAGKILTIGNSST